MNHLLVTLPFTLYLVPVSVVLIAFSLVAMILAICLHDCMQAWTANRLGDPTARMLGRITMNPAMHFDPFGTAVAPLLSIFIFHNALPYGWGKPVPMTYGNFRSKNGEVTFGRRWPEQRNSGQRLWPSSCSSS